MGVRILATPFPPMWSGALRPDRVPLSRSGLFSFCPLPIRVGIHYASGMATQTDTRRRRTRKGRDETWAEWAAEVAPDVRAEWATRHERELAAAYESTGIRRPPVRWWCEACAQDWPSAVQWMSHVSAAHDGVLPKARGTNFRLEGGPR